MKINEEILVNMIKCKTISNKDEKTLEIFYEFHDLLKKSFPVFFSNVSVKDFNGSLLIKWEGSHKWNKDILNPVMFMSHHDVVEANGQWSHPPFLGYKDDKRIWGRGTLDTKGNLWAFLTAAEGIMKEGFKPVRDFYFVTACNEETTGNGAKEIVKYLKHENICLDLLLDEGGMIIPEAMPGVKGLYAMVGIGEKGCSELKFIARGEGGHGSTPGKDTPIVRLSRFINDVEKSNIFTSKMQPGTKKMLSELSKSMDGPLKVLFKNINVTAPLLTKLMPSVSPTAGAMVKTTVAFTMAKGSDAINVIPNEAYIMADMRSSVHQGRKRSIKAITDFAKKYNLETKVVDGGISSPITDYNGNMYKLVSKTIKDVFPKVNVAPYIMLGASDSRFFGEVCSNCIRFAPFIIDTKQLDSIHGNDENVYISSLQPAVDFFAKIFKEI